MQALDPLRLAKVPLGHGVHAWLATPAAYMPNSQGVQRYGPPAKVCLLARAAAVTMENEPGRHERHAICPVRTRGGGPPPLPAESSMRNS